MQSDPDENSHDEQQDVKVIQVHFDDSYDTVAVQQGELDSNSGSSKGKYYKQTYRQAWENMPDFKGWLRGVQGEPTRAYCLYCQKTLHAHRLSLLKHTCTIKHQKAAQIHKIRKYKDNMSALHSEQVMLSEAHDESQAEQQEDENVVEYAVAVDVHEEEEINEDFDEEEEENEDGAINLESVPVQFQKQFQQQVVSPMATTKPPISTHVLDTSKGIPVNGLQVSLYKLIDGRWTYINEGITNPDGRFANFLERTDFAPGRYKLHYDVDRYFEARKQDSLYPFIEIVFDCKTSSDHYHVPLLLSPFGYTTYRGS